MHQQCEILDFLTNPPGNTGYYLKSFNIDSGCVICCNDHTQQDYTLPTQVMVVPMVIDVGKVQLCISSGYYVVYLNKECPEHDTCHNVVKSCFS